MVDQPPAKPLNLLRAESLVRVELKNDRSSFFPHGALLTCQGAPCPEPVNLKTIDPPFGAEWEGGRSPLPEAENMLQQFMRTNDELSSYWRSLTKRPTVATTSLRILSGFVDEYGLETVCEWLRKAWENTHDKDDESLGRYVCGIRRKIKETSPSVPVRLYQEDPDVLLPQYQRVKSWPHEDFHGLVAYLEKQDLSLKVPDPDTFLLGHPFDPALDREWPRLWAIKALQANELFYHRHWACIRRDEAHCFERDAILKYPSAPGMDMEFPH